MRLESFRIRVWDAPTRLFHWAIVLLVATSWVTQELDWMRWHFLSGYTLLAALLFRLAWGVVGSETARFSHFLRSPLAALRHLRELPRHRTDTIIGHNAAGGWMVVVLLLLLGIQVGTGLCANDEISVQGPLADLVGDGWSNYLTHIHALNFKLIEVAIVLHLLALAGYRLLGHDLLRPMITGWKRLPSSSASPRMANPLLALAIFVVAALAVAAGVRTLGG
ncbi:MAG TPA: cytochrome b/b6 domain-containing protein [Acetobacteraceae bacterium]|nr:cytochrome b/b6 domain-containing protein [Acetobacteraceae bacterium]